MVLGDGIHTVLPAHAGVSRRFVDTLVEQTGAPRTRGGESKKADIR